MSVTSPAEDEAARSLSGEASPHSRYALADAFRSPGKVLVSAIRSRTLAVILLMATALALRLVSVGRLSLWVDEAESSINGLTIIQHGVPTGTYLGMPVYENTHILPWTENSEYRYRDVSYSPEGYALYHGWVPLYAIAAALWVADIRPDELVNAPAAVHTPQERRLRTIVPRIPSVVFGVIAVFLFYLAGKTLYGADAGLAAGIITSLSPMHIFVSQQARYFSATVLVSAWCAYATWQMVWRQRWRDCILAGVAFGVLFHTHALTFVISSVMCGSAVLVAAMCGRSVAWLRITAAASVTAIFVLPWMIATKFLQTAAMLPSAWRLMSLPEDLTLYRALFPLYRPATLLLLLIALGFLAMRYRPLALRRWIKPFTNHGPSFAFLLCWLVISYFGFIFLIPAASYAITRIGVVLLAPATLLLACFFAALARSLRPRSPGSAASLLALVMVVVSYWFWPTPTEAGIASQHNDINAAMSYIARVRSQPSTRVYANPNDHLLLTYYSGVPVQSIASVRKEFLNRYEGDIALLLRKDFFVRDGDPIDAPHLQQAARQHGLALSMDQARVLSSDLATLSERRAAARQCAEVIPAVQPPPDFARAAYVAWEQVRDQRQREYASTWVRFPMFRGYDIRTITEWWTVFFFRFSGADAELRNPNYEARLRNAVAMPLRGANWMSYYSGRPVFSR